MTGRGKNILHADTGVVALAQGRSTVGRVGERGVAVASRTVAEVATASRIVKGKAHGDVEARNSGKIALAEVRGGEVTLEESAAGAVRLAALTGLAEGTAGEPLCTHVSTSVTWSEGKCTNPFRNTSGCHTTLLERCKLDERTTSRGEHGRHGLIAVVHEGDQVITLEEGASESRSDGREGSNNNSELGEHRDGKQE
jgi:hypothetical protein